MTKKDIAARIAEGHDIARLQALEIVQQVFDGIIDTLLSEGRIELRNSDSLRGEEADAPASAQSTHG